MIDGEISDDEQQEFCNLVTKQEYVVPLQRAVMRSIGGSWNSILQRYQADTRSPADVLRDVKSMLTKKLSAEDATPFMHFLVCIGGMIAAAPEAKGEVTPNEMAALKVLLQSSEG